ncbi:MAG: hypothetical protein A3G41_00220 [Elusimicrobia bacterium RIFCSPLOWO2_12_FULL_59_9]|nr:MAG: hypothetical protein A3G41_00220 [Elusimicrobia bacterium RIFCSPLOWO2_12_FULL_59_9]
MGGDFLSDLTPRSRELRRSPTDAERVLWRRLRLRQAGTKFRRQAVIGRYIVDFVCFEKKLIIELDGGQHLKKRSYDSNRTAWLQGQGFKLIRFWNHEVLQNITAVEKALFAELGPPPHSSPTRGEAAGSLQ